MGDIHRNRDLGNRNRNGGEIYPEIVRREIILMGDAMPFVFLVIRIGMSCVFIVRASVQLADLLDKAYHCLMVVVGHHSGEQHHHHGDERREYGDSSEHLCKLKQKTPDNPIFVSSFFLPIFIIIDF